MEAQSKGSSSAIAGIEGTLGVALPGMPPSPATSLMPVSMGKGGQTEEEERKKKIWRVKWILLLL